MNPELQTRLDKIAEALADRLTKAESFVLEQAPDVLREAAIDGFLRHALPAAGCFLAGAVLLIAASIVAWVAWRDLKQDRYSLFAPAAFAAAAVMGAGSFALVGHGAYCTVQATRWHYAPKAMLLREIGVLKQ